MNDKSLVFAEPWMPRFYERIVFSAGGVSKSCDRLNVSDDQGSNPM
ncbi:MAG: hypothetical protein ACYTFW_26665 [Planctomycetota bacterium]